jgi:hypothetical protein
MTKDEALRLALEFLEALGDNHWNDRQQAITAIKAALEAKDEPVAWMVNVDLANYQGQSEYRTILAWNAKPVWSGTHEINEVLKAVPLYTTPPQRTWVGLTDEEIEQGCKESWITEQAFQSAVWWAEAKLKEKNT